MMTPKEQYRLAWSLLRYEGSLAVQSGDYGALRFEYREIWLETLMISNTILGAAFKTFQFDCEVIRWPTYRENRYSDMLERKQRQKEDTNIRFVILPIERWQSIQRRLIDA